MGKKGFNIYNRTNYFINLTKSINEKDFRIDITLTSSAYKTYTLFPSDSGRIAINPIVQESHKIYLPENGNHYLGFLPNAQFKYFCQTGARVVRLPDQYMRSFCFRTLKFFVQMKTIPRLDTCSIRAEIQLQI